MLAGNAGVPLVLLKMTESFNENCWGDLCRVLRQGVCLAARFLIELDDAAPSFAMIQNILPHSERLPHLRLRLQVSEQRQEKSAQLNIKVDHG